MVETPSIKIVPVPALISTVLSNPTPHADQPAGEVFDDEAAFRLKLPPLVAATKFPFHALNPSYVATFGPASTPDDLA